MKHNFNYEYNNIQISPLEEKNIDDMRILRNKHRHCFVYTEIISAEAQVRWYQNYLKEPNDYIFSVYCNNTWIGVCSIYNVKEHEAEFGRLLIDKTKCTLKKLGLNTTKCACEFAINQLGLKRIILQVYETNTPAYKTYIQAGFVPFEERFDEKGQKLIYMKLEV